MQFVIRPLRVPRSGASRAGFTLIEMLVALSVVGIASTLFLKMYTTSMDLGKLSRNREVALDAAESQLNLLIMNPADYQWDTAAANPEGLFRIRRDDSDPRAGWPIDVPAVMPFDKTARAHQQTVYDQFRWRAFGKLAPQGLYYEVFVDVYWEQQGRQRHLTLTGAVARGRVDAAWKQEATQ